MMNYSLVQIKKNCFRALSFEANAAHRTGFSGVKTANKGLFEKGRRIQRIRVGSAHLFLQGHHGKGAQK